MGGAQKRQEREKGQNPSISNNEKCKQTTYSSKGQRLSD